MCGIAGTTAADQATLRCMLDRIRHRGPDGEGIWIEERRRIGMAHTRLSVIDLSPASSQPFVSNCGRFALVFNGEIYNYRELRAQLERDGTVFRSHGDTEVVLHLLQQRGEMGLRVLSGMFALAFWDGIRGELLLARDHVGIKPLVYAPLADGHLAFASEIHALRTHPGIDLEMDGDALSEFLGCLYILAPRTIHRGIRKLPPGHRLIWRDGSLTVARFWQADFGAHTQCTLDEAVEEVVPAVRRAIVSQMVSDVPLGCFLSGGIDSSVIAATMAAEARRSGSPPLRTFTMTFDNRAYDESAAARSVSHAVESNHTELRAAFSVFDLLDESLVHFGEPFGNPTSLLIADLSRRAREHVTVALVGDGGDEVFAGYPRYQGGLWSQWLERVPLIVRERALAPTGHLIPESTTGRHSLRRMREFLSASHLPRAMRYASWVEYFSLDERRQLLGPGAHGSRVAETYVGSGLRDPLDAMQYTDLETFLPGNLLTYGDAMSMWHALELRLPLVDHRLIETVAQIPPSVRFARGKKTLLRAVARRLLPRRLVDRPKRGFNPPTAQWLRGPLAERVRSQLTPERMRGLGISWRPVQRLIAESESGWRDHGLKLWALLVLEAWARGPR
jgi:asparagine synthase (glutamine-hydrolysing)